ncbi:MAG: hypothetical protein E7307_02730 [Butyrivibrio sp.]|nr:hypothetical protein [Butyrivibrio sp.]
MTVGNYAGFGFVFGLMFAAVLCVILFKFANSNRKIMSEYDERQEVIRNKGYKYSFYTVLALEAAMIVVSVSEMTFPIATYLIHLGIVLIGCLVLCIYCIWNDAYWGLNNNRKRYTAIITIAIVLNIIPIIRAISTGELSGEGFDSLPVMNIMVIVWMAIIGATAIIKKLVKTDGEEA